MFNSYKTLLFRSFVFLVLTAFTAGIPVPLSFAQVPIIMPQAGEMIYMTRHFEPPQMVGIKVNLKDPFTFSFIMDQGQSPMTDDLKKKEFNKIIKYFLVSLAMPNKDMWVNLSPYESKRVIPEIFAQTEMGRDLLAQDYVLKQFTSSLMNPNEGLGKKFWDKVYSQAKIRFGTTDIKINTFNKVWIVADHADVYQKNDTAFLVDSHLKIMLDQDYMAMQKHGSNFILGETKDIKASYDSSAKAQNNVSTLGSQVVREILVPAIEKEVNEGRNFAIVRQVYNAEIMATWFKKTLRQSLLAQVFADKSKVAGQKVSDPQATENIYKQYLKAYRIGVFNFVKVDTTSEGQSIPRKYFSGGAEGVNAAMIHTIISSNDRRVVNFAQIAGRHAFRFCLVVTALMVAGIGLSVGFSSAHADGVDQEWLLKAFPQTDTHPYIRGNYKWTPYIPDEEWWRRAFPEKQEKFAHQRDLAPSVSSIFGYNSLEWYDQMRAAEMIDRERTIRSAHGLNPDLRWENWVIEQLSFHNYPPDYKYSSGGFRPPPKRTVIEETIKPVRLARTASTLLSPVSILIEDARKQITALSVSEQQIRRDLEIASGEVATVRRAISNAKPGEGIVLEALNDILTEKLQVEAVVRSNVETRLAALKDTKSVIEANLFDQLRNMNIGAEEIGYAEAQLHLAEAGQLVRNSAMIAAFVKPKTRAARVADSAALAQKHQDYGGIDLSDEHLAINIKVDGAGMPLPSQYQNKVMANLSGLRSVIHQIVSITPENMPVLFEILK